MKMTVNKYGQVTKTGQIRLKSDTEMLRQSNDGYSPRDHSWREPGRITVPAGTLVKYTFQQTHSGNYHSVEWVDNDGERWYANKKS